MGRIDPPHRGRDDFPPDTRPMPMTLRILITGGAGFIGSHCVHRWVSDGHRVRVLDDLSAGDKDALPSTGTSLHIEDVRDQEALRRVAEGVDLMVHLACVVGVDAVTENPSGTTSVILEGTKSALETARDVGCPLVYFSSSEITDEERSGPRSAYARAKRQAENMILDQKPWAPLAIVRPFNVVGPGQACERGAVLPALAQAAQEGQPLPVHGDGTQTRSFIHVEDFVELFHSWLEAWLVVQPSITEVVEIGSRESIAIGAVAEQLAYLAGAGSSVQTGVLAVDREDRPRRLPDLEVLLDRVSPTPLRSLDVILADVLAVSPRSAAHVS